MQAPQPADPKRFAGIPVKIWLAIAAVSAVAIVGAVVVFSGKDDDKKVTAVPTSVATTTDGSTDPTTTTDPTTPDDTTPDDTTPSTEPTNDTTPLTTVGTDEPLEGEIAGAPAGATGTRDQPVAAGEIANIGGGWRLQVLGVTPDATADVLAFSEFNEAPPAGSTYTTIKVALGYFGLEDPASALMPTINAVGGSNIELPAECGSTPDELDVFGELFAGGVIVGNVCVVTVADDIPVLQLAAQGDFFQEDEVFLQATTPAAATALTALKGPQPGAASTGARLAPMPFS